MNAIELEAMTKTFRRRGSLPVRAVDGRGGPDDRDKHDLGAAGLRDHRRERRDRRETGAGLVRVRSQGAVSGRQAACRSAAGDSRGRGTPYTTHPEKAALRAAQSIALSGDGLG